MSFRCYHRLPRAAWHSYKFTSPVYKTSIVGAPGRGQSCTLVVGKEAMAPRTIGGFARRMAHSGHICHENLGSIGIEGLALMSALGHGLDIHPRNLDPMAYGRHTLRTTLRGCILEFTYIGGPTPSLITSYGLVFHLGNQRPMAHGELTEKWPQ